LELVLLLLVSGLILIAIGAWRHWSHMRDVDHLMRKAEEDDRKTKIAKKDPRVTVSWHGQA
jgi:ABC-type nickel/cobalt efflux system permease component RcnA